jgi:acetolactate synthase-1/2/3 large subunit
VYATTLKNPDFVALARAYGAHGEAVEDTAAFAPAFGRAVKAAESSRRPALIELRIDPQAITTSTTLDAIRARALKG